MWRRVYRCSALYRRELWNIAPINPLCLEDTSLSWLLTTTEGSQDVSAHALSSYIMLTQCTYHISHTYSTSLSPKWQLTPNCQRFP